MNRVIVLNVDPASNRILSAGYVAPPSTNALIVDSIPDSDLYDYLYIDGEYIYDPLPIPDDPEPKPTQEERIKALEEKLAITEILLGVE